jgi:hypothetical protein
MEMALGIVQLLNAAAPGIAQLVVMIKGTDGKITVAALLDQADAQFDKNLSQAAEWLKAHGK